MDYFTELADIQRQIKALEKRAHDLKGIVMVEMPDKTYDLPDGTRFSISYRKKWSYPEDVIHAEEMLKGMKKAAEKTGQATFEETPVLSVKLAS